MKYLLLIILTLTVSLSVIGQELMTIGKVFDFAVGDEFQIAGFADGQPPNADRITIKDKYFPADSNTVFYVEYHDSYYSYLEGWDSLVYVFNKWTDTVSYANLDSSITTYTYWVDYDTNMFDYDTVIGLSEYYCDRLINGFSYSTQFFEPEYRAMDFGKGLGMVRDYYSYPAEFYGYENKLFYYKKDGVSCGTPDTLAVSVHENITKTDIRIFPNPAINFFIIDNQSDENLNMKVFDNTGKLLDSTIINKGETHYDCSSFRSGMYFISFTTERKKYAEKLIIE